MQILKENTNITGNACKVPKFYFLTVVLMKRSLPMLSYTINNCFHYRESFCTILYFGKLLYELENK